MTSPSLRSDPLAELPAAAWAAILDLIESRRKKLWDRYTSSWAFAPPPHELARAKAQVLEEVFADIRGELVILSQKGLTRG